MANTSSTEELPGDQIDMSSLVAVLWKRWKLILFGTLGATILSIVISLFIPRTYLSEGFYQLGDVKKTITMNKDDTTSIGIPFKENTASVGVAVQLYKSIAMQFSNLNHFQLIASQSKLLNEEIVKRIRVEFQTAADINKWIKPVYAYAKDDAREFVQMPKDNLNSVIGVSLSYETDSPDKALTHVRFFGEYIRDCVLYASLYNYVSDEYNNSISEMKKIENSVIGVRFQLSQNTNKLKDIQAILTNYPETARIENRQLVSIQEGGARFLSPVTQLVGIESTLADLRRQLENFEREKEKNSIRLEFFSLCNSNIAKIGEIGESFFLMLKATKDEVFKNKDHNKDAVKEVFNSLSIDLQTFELAFFNNCRFTSGPTFPTTNIRPRRSLIVIISCFVSFFLLVILAFILNLVQCKNERSGSGKMTSI